MTGGWGRSLVLTGASGGLGRALAADCAAPGVTMLLLGRDRARLGETAALAAARGARVEQAAIDVRDAAAMAARLSAFDAASPVDMVIANAGISAGVPPGPTATPSLLEPPGTLGRLVATNLLGAANTVEPLLPAMLERGRGRVVLIGSLAGLRPVPDLAGYAAAKAGLAAWGAALRPRLAAGGVRLTVVEPGFVTSPMSARHLGPRPFEIPAPVAARRIMRAAIAGRRLCRFPWPLAVAALIGARLPPVVADRLLGAFDARIAPLPDRPAGARGDRQA